MRPLTLALLLCACRATAPVEGEAPRYDVKDVKAPDVSALPVGDLLPPIDVRYAAALVLKCHILATGAITSCRVLESVSPSFDRRFIARLESTRVTPATHKGEPMDMPYVFRFRWARPD